MKLIQFKLNHLDKTQFDMKNIEYKDIINYEIVREAICGLIFKLSRLEKIVDSNQQEIIQKNINKLIYIRDNIQIQDHLSIKNIMNQIRSFEF
ncbi:hypothetical protein ABFP04_13405 [Acinetobacter towneri]|uniref:hypothetical protein n=1 Tax=Acinetobacter towneri TaxID=202956 RepID=UPI00241D3BBD